MAQQGVYGIFKLIFNTFYFMDYSRPANTNLLADVANGIILLPLLHCHETLNKNLSKKQREKRFSDFTV